MTNELNIDVDAELVWGLKYYGRALYRQDDSELSVGSLLLKAAERIKELSSKCGS
jgi:hypothetical protein